MLENFVKSSLSRERGTIYKKGDGRAIRIALVYPNTYYVGMSNLGFQTIYRHLNERDDVICERAFLPNPDDLRDLIGSSKALITLEALRPLNTYDIVAFSVSFENDYPNLIRILELAHIPVFSKNRTKFDPVVLIGGAITYINPEPLVDFADCMVIGDGEEASYAYIDRFIKDQGTTRERHLENVASLNGLYVPALHNLSSEVQTPIKTGLVAKQKVTSFEDYPAYSAILTPDTEFGDMLLVEISRGCPRRCRFCAVSYVYPKFRALKPSTILDLIRNKNKSLARDGHGSIKAIGLVSSAMCDYPYLDELCAGLKETGLRIGVSSVRVDLIPESLLNLMLSTGLQTMTIAPEAGSERLRKVINKPMSSAEILIGARRILEKGIKNLKLYFMVGLPMETDKDIDELIELTKQLAELQKKVGKPGGRLRLSINPFVPKALTPFQWSSMATPKEVKQKLNRIQKGLRRTPSVKIKHESLKSAYFEAILSRGGRELAPFLIETMRQNGDWKRAAGEIGMDPTRYLGDMAKDKSLPWNFISTDKENYRLQWEYRKSHNIPYRKLKDSAQNGTTNLF
tara:strand:+ start:46883 stop:48595 length:1713 start_codon:yes stop_codon:yes gene_type:complete